LGVPQQVVYAGVMTNPNPTHNQIHVNKNLQSLPQFAVLIFLT